MKKTLVLALVAALAGAVWAANARISQGTVYTAISGKELADLLTKEGYQPTLTQDKESGKPKISFKVKSKTVWVFFYDCNKTEFCGSFGLSSGWDLDKPLDAKKVNSFNYDNRYVKISTDDQNDPYLDSDHEMAGGVTLENVKDFVGNYVSYLDDFITEFKLR